jgi:glycosyltransferase involved in cell wall biosynthesis
MTARTLMIVQSHYVTDPRVRRQAEALVGAGHTVHVIALRAPGAPRVDDVAGVRVHGVPLGRRFGSRRRYAFEYAAFAVVATVLAAALHVRHRYHVVQVANLPDTLVVAGLLPRLLGARLVFDAHESMPETFRTNFGWRPGGVADRAAIWLQCRCIGLADHVLMVHEPARRLLVGRGVPRERSSVVMNWPDRRIFRPAAAPEPSGDRPFTVVYAGTVARRYGTHTAVRAVALLRAELPDLRFLVLGTGDYLAEARALAADLGVDDIVTFRGMVPLADVAAAYRSADVGVAPLEDTDYGHIAFSTKTAEYLAVGLPAIVAKTDVMAHYFDEDHVVFFAPGDPVDLAACLRRVHDDGELRRTLIANGLALADRYNWQAEADGYVALVGALAAGTPAAAVTPAASAG